MRRPGEKGRVLDYAVPAGIGFLIFLALLSFRGAFETTDREQFLLLLCDAFFVPGILLTGIALLVIVADGGAFDAIHYGLQKLFSLMRSEEKRAQMPRTYYDFVTLKHGGKSRKPAALLQVGGLFLLCALISFLLYARVTVW